MPNPTTDKLAFPFVSHGGVHEHQHVDDGMTLRDYFAAKAMQAYVASDYEGAAGHDTKAAEWAYSLADAMLAERAKGAK